MRKVEKPQVEEHQTYKEQIYKELGFTDYQVLKLMSVKDLYYGNVRTLIEKGCPVNIAYRIYRP